MVEESDGCEDLCDQYRWRWRCSQTDVPYGLMPGLATTAKIWARHRTRGLLGQLVGAPPPHAGVYQSLTELGGRYRSVLAANDDLSSYEARVFSQHGEDGVTAEILARIGRVSSYFVEFGVGSGQEGNCVLLADAFAWSGLFIEADPGSFGGLSAKYLHNSRVDVRRTLVTTENIESTFVEAGVPAEPDILSIDVDGTDYWLWKSVTNFRPRLIIIEYNSSVDLDRQLVRPCDEVAGWDGESAWFGASLGAMEHLGRAKGYTLVHTDMTGIDAFFVRDDLAALVGIPKPPRRSSNFCLQGVVPLLRPTAAPGWTSRPPHRSSDRGLSVPFGRQPPTDTGLRAFCPCPPRRSVPTAGRWPRPPWLPGDPRVRAGQQWPGPARQCRRTGTGSLTGRSRSHPCCRPRR